jgi:hypothetical protein
MGIWIEGVMMAKDEFWVDDNGTRRLANAEELADIARMTAFRAEEQAAEAAKQQARQALLDKLGITEEEAKLLLG